MALSDFDIDLSVGHEGEALVKDLLTGGQTVEVKKDLKWKDTGNVYIETVCWSHNKGEWYPSGLSATKADYWAFVLESMVILIRTETLKRAVAVRGRAINCNIQPNPSKGYLIKPEDLIEAAKQDSAISK